MRKPPGFIPEWQFLNYFIYLWFPVAKVTFDSVLLAEIIYLTTLMVKNATLLSCLAAVLLMSSCYTAKIAHGSLTTDSPVVKVNSKKNQALIEGLIPLNEGFEAKKYVGERKDYVTKSQITFVDGLLRLITLGIYTPSTTFFYVPLNEAPTK